MAKIVTIMEVEPRLVINSFFIIPLLFYFDLMS